MFFLTRCTFWLGVVAWQLPWPALEPGLPQSGIALVKSLDASAIVADVDALCSVSPRVCAEAVKRTGAAVVVAPAARAELSVKPQTVPAAARRPRTSPDSASRSKGPGRLETAQRRPEPPG